MKIRTGESGFFAAKALLRAFATEKGVPKFHVDPTAIPHYNPSTHTVVCKGTPRGDLSPEALTNFRAALDHELAESQITTWHIELCKRYPDDSDPKDLRLVCNGIGDVKVDNWIGSQYPGTELNLHKAIRQDLEAFIARQDSDPISPLNPWNRVLMTAVACRYVGDDVCTINELVTRIPQMAFLFEAIRHEVEHLAWDGSDIDLVDQGERLYKLAGGSLIIREEQLKEAVQRCVNDGQGAEGEVAPALGQEEGEEEGATGSGSSDGTTTSTGSGTGSSTDDSGTDDSHDVSCDDESDSETNDSADSSTDPVEETKGLSNADTYDEADLEWDIQQKLLDRFNEELGNSRGSNYIVDSSKDVVIEENKLGINRTSYYEEIRKLACWDQYARLGGALAVRIKQALVVPTRQYRINRDEGAIDPRTVHRIASGLPGGFRKRLPIEANDTAIMIGVDASSSMLDGRNELARDLTFILNDACRRLKVPLFVYDWTTDQNHTKSIKRYWSDNENDWLYARGQGLKIRILKNWNSLPKSSQVLNNLAAIGGTGSTPTGESLAFGCERLALRQERKKILFFLTDGCPDHAKGHFQLIQSVLEEAKRRGLIVIVLGMDAYDTQNIFRGHWIHVHTASDFIHVTTKMLVDVIRNWRP